MKIPFTSKLDKSFYEKHYIDRFFCVCEYTGMMRKAIIRFKSYGKAASFRTFGLFMTKKLKDKTNVESFDGIVYIPVSNKRLVERGYNQAYLLAKSISKLTGINVIKNVLKRTLDTKSQKELNRTARIENIRGVFKVEKPDKIKEKNILLVDDIMTTGSTLNEASHVLKNAGAKKITAIVLASGRKY